MMRFLKITAILLGGALCHAGPGLAWDDPPEGISVLMTASCSGSEVILSIDLVVLQDPPAHLVGWRVDRQVIGPCEEDAWVTEVMPWPELGETHYDLDVLPDQVFFDPIYRIWAVDAEGNRTFIYWPQRHNFAHADCRPGPSTVGRFVSYAGSIAFEACTEWCWPGLSPFDGSYPDGVEDLVDSGQVMELYGELFMGMEGIYINATSMAPSGYPCDPVPVQSTTWSGLKAGYR
jgi:hypothetical protein